MKIELYPKFILVLSRGEESRSMGESVVTWTGRVRARGTTPRRNAMPRRALSSIGHRRCLATARRLVAEKREVRHCPHFVRSYSVQVEPRALRSWMVALFFLQYSVMGTPLTSSITK